jgi:hypothetical protein
MCRIEYESCPAVLIVLEFEHSGSILSHCIGRSFPRSCSRFDRWAPAHRPGSRRSGVGGTYCIPAEWTAPPSRLAAGTWDRLPRRSRYELLPAYSARICNISETMSDRDIAGIGNSSGTLARRHYHVSQPAGAGRRRGTSHTSIGHEHGRASNICCKLVPNPYDAPPAPHPDIYCISRIGASGPRFVKPPVL